MVDRLSGLIRDVASASGVTLRGPSRGKEVFGKYEAQTMSRKTVSVEALNAHGEWEVLVEGGEEYVCGALATAKRLFDIGLQGRFKAATSSPATWIGVEE